MRVSFTLNEDRYYGRRHEKIMTELINALGNEKINSMIDIPEMWKVTVSGDYYTTTFNLSEDEFKKSTSKKQSFFRKYSSVLESD